MKCYMDHIVLNVEDDVKMIHFYSKVLMLEPERLVEYRSGKVPFPSVRLNPDTVIDLFPKKMWKKDSVSNSGYENLNHFCFNLCKSDWDKLIKRLNDNNVAIEGEPAQRWGAHGTGTSIYFRDPENNLVEARYY